MSSHALTVVAITVTLLAGADTVRMLLVSPLAAAPAARVSGTGAAPAEVPISVNGDSVASRIAARNPFRAHRTPAAARYTADFAAGAPQPVRPAQPAVTLAGIVLGAEPAALLDGLPGVEGTRVLHLGETVGGYTLRSLTTDRAVVVARDTTLILTMRNRLP